MSTHARIRKPAFLLAVAIAALLLVSDTGDRGELVLGGGDAHAVVGRPLTPVSYAGVARRTARRTTRRVAAASAPVGVIYSLPSGCIQSGGYYTCGTVRYRAYYDGPTVVYQPM